jgi:hypothetical protein
MIATELTEMFGHSTRSYRAYGWRIRWTFGGHRIERRRAGVGRRRLLRSGLAEGGVVSRECSDEEALGRWTDYLVGESKCA